MVWMRGTGGPAICHRHGTTYLFNDAYRAFKNPSACCPWASSSLGCPSIVDLGRNGPLTRMRAYTSANVSRGFALACRRRLARFLGLRGRYRGPKLKSTCNSHLGFGSCRDCHVGDSVVATHTWHLTWWSKSVRMCTRSVGKETTVLTHLGVIRTDDLRWIPDEAARCDLSLQSHETLVAMIAHCLQPRNNVEPSPYSRATEPLRGAVKKGMCC